MAAALAAVACKLSAVQLYRERPTSVCKVLTPTEILCVPMTLPNSTSEDNSEIELDDIFPRNVQDCFPIPEGVEPVLLWEEGRYSAYAYDLDFMWRWVVVRDGEEVQDGPAISVESARQCVKHVMAFFSQRDRNVANA